jgi:hypothetical protein
MAKKQGRKVKFDTSFNFGANARLKRRSGSGGGRRGGKGKWSKFGS